MGWCTRPHLGLERGAMDGGVLVPATLIPRMAFPRDSTTPVAVVGSPSPPRVEVVVAKTRTRGRGGATEQFVARI